MEGNLGTTNLFLGIIAITSVLEALLVIGTGIAMFVVYRRIGEAYQRALAVIETVEQRHVAPAMVSLHAILADVKDATAAMKDVTATVQSETSRMDHAFRSTIDRVDYTAERVRNNVRAKTSRIVGFVRGARTIIETFLNSRAA